MSQAISGMHELSRSSQKLIAAIKALLWQVTSSETRYSRSGNVTFYYNSRGNPDPRKIIWYTDGRGNSGKTFISRYPLVKKNAFWVENYKSADLKYAYDGQPIVIFDLTRSMQEHFIVVVVGCHRWDTHACATCGQMYRREGWLSRHYETGPRIH